MKNNSLFEISINSQKLGDFLSNIQKILDQQESRTQQINKKFNNKIVELSQKMQKMQAQIKNNDKQIRSSILNQALIQKDLVKKAQQKSTHLNDIIETKLACMNVKLLEDKDKLSIVQNKAQYSFHECKQIKNIKTMMANFQKQLGEIKCDAFKTAIEEYMGKSQQDKIDHLVQESFFKLIENDRVQDFLANRKKFIHIQENGNRRNHKQSLTQKDAMFYAAISEKLDKLQKKLVQKNNQQLNKVLYPSKSPLSTLSNFNQTFSSRKSTFAQISQQQRQQNSQMVKNITSKLQNIENIINNKVLQLKKQLVRQLDKSQVMNQKLNILNKRLQKQKLRLNDLLSQFKKFSQKKFDQKMIETFRYEIRQKSIDYQDNLDTKVGKQTFEKERTKNNQRIKIIHENLTEKVDKSEIKKAIMFLQAKIKEIIILIAGSYDEDRQGSIKKTPFKCLSCDKELQHNLMRINQNFKQKQNISEKNKQMALMLNQISLKKSDSTNSTMKLRCATSRVRRNIKLSSCGGTTQGTFPITPANLD